MERYAVIKKMMNFIKSAYMKWGKQAIAMLLLNDDTILTGARMR